MRIMRVASFVCIRRVECKSRVWAHRETVRFIDIGYAIKCICGDHIFFPFFILMPFIFPRSLRVQFFLAICFLSKKQLSDSLKSRGNIIMTSTVIQKLIKTIRRFFSSVTIVNNQTNSHSNYIIKWSVIRGFSNDSFPSAFFLFLSYRTHLNIHAFSPSTHFSSLAAVFPTKTISPHCNSTRTERNVPKL